MHIQEKYGRMIELTLFFTKKIHPLSDRFYSIIHFWGIQTQNENPRFLQMSFSKNIPFFICVENTIDICYYICYKQPKEVLFFLKSKDP